MTDRPKQAEEIFDGGFNCAQAVVAAMCEDFGLPRSQGLKVAAGFGGGMGGTGNVCGALSGAFIVLGLAGASDQPGDKAAKKRTYDRVERAAEMFRQRNGTINCCDLLGFVIKSREGIEKARLPGAFDNCGRYVRDAVEIIQEILSEA